MQNFASLARRSARLSISVINNPDASGRRSIAWVHVNRTSAPTPSPLVADIPRHHFTFKKHCLVIVHLCIGEFIEGHGSVVVLQILCCAPYQEKIIIQQYRILKMYLAAILGTQIENVHNHYLIFGVFGMHNDHLVFACHN